MFLHTVALSSTTSTGISPIMVAENLARHFRVRVDQEGFFGRISSFFNPKYRLIKALDGVSFTVHPGESIGYIGLNGAGKSTTIKLLCGVLVPTSGRVVLDGLEPFRNRTKIARRIGLMMGQRTQLLWDLPVRESFDLLGRIYDLRRETYLANRKRLLDALDIASLMDTPARMLSLGQKTRCDLALTFLHDPVVVFLDEPTIGLDILARERIRDFLKAEKKRGVTIFLASHDLDDLEIVTDRVMLLHRGQLLFDGTKDALREFTGTAVGSLEDIVRRFYKEADLG